MANRRTKKQASRREFLGQASLTGLGLGYWAAGGVALAESKSPNEKLNIALIGAGGKGAANLAGVASQNIVALCDVDAERAKVAFTSVAKATKYVDFRVMLDKQKDIDAVVVSTPDHMHAPASLMAMNLGKHVYCEKPLTHSIWEARLMRETAAKNKVATQMGNQGHSNNGARKAVEVVRSGALGQVKEVHAWTDRPNNYWKQAQDRPQETQPVPQTLNWDLWLGVAPERPYNPSYVPFSWRGWWDFGTGALGDMACHVLDMAYWALKLDNPTSVDAKVSDHHPESPPAWSVITYKFPARGELAPCTLTWYDGGKMPPADLIGKDKLPGNGSILVGEKGTLFSPDPYGSTFTLLPKEKFADFKAPEAAIPRSPGHYREWINACKGGPAALSNFEYSSRLTETVLLGNLALRAGKPIDWDAAAMRATNCAEAEPWIHGTYRSGWNLS